jgi:hypothetical protein
MSNATTMLDKLSEVIDNVSTPTSRAGFTVNRVGTMRKAGVSLGVIALQMSENSQTGQKYTTKEIQALEKVYKDCKTKACITKKQAQALTKDSCQDLKGQSVALES